MATKSWINIRKYDAVSRKERTSVTVFKGGYSTMVLILSGKTSMLYCDMIWPKYSVWVASNLHLRDST